MASTHLDIVIIIEALTRKLGTHMHVQNILMNTAISSGDLDIAELFGTKIAEIQRVMKQLPKLATIPSTPPREPTIRKNPHPEENGMQIVMIEIIAQITTLKAAMQVSEVMHSGPHLQNAERESELWTELLGRTRTLYYAAMDDFFAQPNPHSS